MQPASAKTFHLGLTKINRSDLYQLYADVLLNDGEEQFTVRLGRQEIRYGSDRLIMAAIWPNQRRTHDSEPMTV